MSLCLGIDPGQTTAFALVESGAPGRRPVLRGLRLVYGAEWHGLRLVHGVEWHGKLRAALDELLALGMPDLVAVERLQPVLRATAGVRHHRAAAGLAEARGAVLHALATLLPGVERWDCTTGDWTGALGVPAGKSGDGLHRISEALLVVDGAREALGALSTRTRTALDRRVDAAEAVLIAAAGLVELRGRAVARRAGVRA